MQVSFFFDLITRKPALLNAMLDFNGVDGPARPAVSSEQLADYAVPGLKMSRLLTSPVFRRRLGLDDKDTFWEFGDEVRRLAFLSEDEFSRLALYFGVCVHGPSLARIVLRSEVLALRAALGESVYRYALQRGRYQLGSVRHLFLNEDTEHSLADRIRLHGWKALAICCADWPAALRCRVPVIEALPQAFLSEQLPPAARRVLWYSLKKLLVKEVAPQWAPCFD